MTTKEKIARYEKERVKGTKEEYRSLMGTGNPIVVRKLIDLSADTIRALQHQAIDKGHGNVKNYIEWICKEQAVKEKTK